MQKNIQKSCFDLTEDYASLKLLVQTFSMNGSYSKALSIVEPKKKNSEKKGKTPASTKH